MLTKELALRARKVVAIELDARLPALLAETLAGFSNIRVVQGDALKLDLAALIRQEFPGMKVAVCANLPYYITSPLVMKLLEDKLPLQHITVMVQKQASAQRLAALPGTREAGAVSYAVHYYARPQVLFQVQPGSFYPPPKRDKRCAAPYGLHTAPPAAPQSEKAMFRTIRAAFSQRRKTAANAVSAGLGLPKADVAAALQAVGAPPAALAGTADAGTVCRAERPSVSFAEWRRGAPVKKRPSRPAHTAGREGCLCNVAPGGACLWLCCLVRRVLRNGKADAFQNKVAVAAFRQVIYVQRPAVLPGEVGLQGAGHAVQKREAHLPGIVHVKLVLLRLWRAGKQRALLGKTHFHKAVALLHRARQA